MKVQRKELLNALKAVMPGVAAKEAIEQSASFVFMDDTIFTYNDELAVSHPFKIDLEGAVPAKELFGFLSRVSTEEVSLEIKGAELVLKSGKSKVGLRLDAEIHLPLEELGKPTKWVTIPEGFLEGIKFCLFSVSKEANKAILQNVHVFKNVVESTDNFRATKFYMDDDAEDAFPKSMLIPSNAVKELGAYSPDKYAVTSGWLHFKNKAGVTFSCRCMDEDFPDISSVLKMTGCGVEFPDTILDVLNRASVINAGERVTIILEKDVLIVATEGSAGWFEEEIAIDYDDEDIQFDINPEFMISILKHTSKAVVSKKLLKFETDDFEHVASVMIPVKK